MAEQTEIRLKHPLPIGDGRELAAVKLRRPLAGDLRGVRLAQLLQMDTDAVAEVVARVSDPLLPAARFWLLDPEDLTELSLAVVGFFTGSIGSPGASSP